MPELPEVERARLLIHSNFLNKAIVDVETVVDDIVYQGCTNQEFATKVKGRTLVDTGRRGKVFYLILDQHPCPVLHLGMTGSVRIKGQAGLEYKDFSTAGDDWPPRFYKFVIRFDDGQELAFTDMRRLARIRLVDGDPLLHPPISELGFDPLLSMPDLDVFSETVRKRKCPIKALLLDQAFSAGVGNWVADEVLFQARVHPAQNTVSLTDAELAALHDQLSFVIKTAVAVNADSSKFPNDWLFHYRWGKGRVTNREAKMPDGSNIKFETVAGRTTAIVPAVQKLHGNTIIGRRKNKTKSELKEEDTGASHPDAAEEVPIKGNGRKRIKVERDQDIADVESSPRTTRRKRIVKQEITSPEAAEFKPPAKSKRLRTPIKKEEPQTSSTATPRRHSTRSHTLKQAIKMEPLDPVVVERPVDAATSSIVSAFGHPIPDFPSVDLEDADDMIKLFQQVV
ncbi:formamidopyrimidine-DNA glycosylase [Spizellomyces punctatus DAOM BR117]|uniref:Formamidopyrimidine-DNA glycosylase n=1 Tax=Spizellomyces punctatus (strain DAOM BR117) TaxID=645134 RepID=A0A0L0H7P7_SPIPD|nr:formamidopyrimidine-DNA glycosylase [Spizellomyces punctatus DAOM BR117]KNC96931.1 formamidopyrimidine-DNA glycosylase [Spizellomyces punctatus DAOM BR117]|eukprot:XP_016604971.1 formamidopyrimidine-DNA glycosylase [Spizellomyces punctatus DAOM BR117]